MTTPRLLVADRPGALPDGTSLPPWTVAWLPDPLSVDRFRSVALDRPLPALPDLPPHGALLIPEHPTAWLPHLSDQGMILHTSPLSPHLQAPWRAHAQRLQRWTPPGRPRSTRALVMGIVNVTPDSFSDGGRFLDPSRAIAHGLALASAGADILDVGGESTRPGATPLSADEEIARVVPVIQGLRAQTPTPLSVDTRKAAVARAALDAGADIVNDVSGLLDDPEMAPLIGERGAAAVLMHMRGQPADMQKNTHYDDLLSEVCQRLASSLSLAFEHGVDMAKVTIDPGIGFGKGLTHNLRLMRATHALVTALGRPSLIGPSRKRFLGDLTGRPVSQRGHATTAAVTAAILGGAAIVRVHDVAAAVDAAAVASALRVS